MLDFNFRFPLFDNILYGKLSPFATANHSDNFRHGRQNAIEPEPVTDKGVYALIFPKPSNLKCRDYYHRLIPETYWYCNDLLEYIATVQDADSRAYLRLTILDKHLTTALMKTGEVIQARQLHATNFLSPTHLTEPEDLSNSYIFHLLKVCLAKAYLEVREALHDVVYESMTESMVYTALVGEPRPAFLCLRRRKLPAAKTEAPAKVPESRPEPESTIPACEPMETTAEQKYYDINDLVALNVGSERTIRRWCGEGTITAAKFGRNWRIAESEYNRLKQAKRHTTENKPDRTWN